MPPAAGSPAPGHHGRCMAPLGWAIAAIMAHCGTINTACMPPLSYMHEAKLLLARPLHGECLFTLLPSDAAHSHNMQVSSTQCRHPGACRQSHVAMSAPPVNSQWLAPLLGAAEEPRGAGTLHTVPLPCLAWDAMRPCLYSIAELKFGTPRCMQS